MTTKRTRTIVEDLEQTLLQLMREHRITHDEYRYATDILVSSVKAGEPAHHRCDRLACLPDLTAIPGSNLCVRLHAGP